MDIQCQEDIAIVGMSCLFPGAPNIVTYWENILSKCDAVGDPPEDWLAELFYDPEMAANDRIYCKRGGYLGYLAQFDPTKHGITPNSVDGAEPDQFLALEAAHAALLNAGYFERPVDGKRVEVILGRGTYINRGITTVLQHGLFVDRVLEILKELHPEHTDTELQEIKQQLKKSLPPFNADTAPGIVPNIVSGRIANRLNFQGVNYIVDAACASSLVAVEHGMRDLLNGRCDMAVVGGVHASTPAPIAMIFCQLGALSRVGRIRPFDKDADGTVLGEGVGILVLKRRADAEANGDRIYALLKGIGLASDGRSLSVVAPRVEGEELAMMRAYAAAGLSPRTVGLIEAHGTGIPVGDRTEIEALVRVFGRRKLAGPSCAIGSVKSMIGHLMPASGAAGLIKAALALYHKVLPPTLNVEEPDPEFRLSETPFYLNFEPRPWIQSSQAPRRAGVNSFGFGGINAHAVLEEYPDDSRIDRQCMQRKWPAELFIFQGTCRSDLIAVAKDARVQLSDSNGVEQINLAYGLNHTLHKGSLRLAIVASSIGDLAAKLDHAIERLGDLCCDQIRRADGIYFSDNPLTRSGTLGFLFPGEGSQYPHMLAEISMHFPEVRYWFDLLDRIFLSLGCDFLPSEKIFGPLEAGSADPKEFENKLLTMDFASGAVFAATQGLRELLFGLDIKPQAIVGHSTGEYSAMIASGINPLSSHERLMTDIVDLNRLYLELKGSGQISEGTLVAVNGVAKEVVLSFFEQSGGDLVLAIDNGPHQVVVCGSESSTAALSEALTSQGAVCVILPLSNAYHTTKFHPFCERYHAFLQRFEIRSPLIPVYSCNTANKFPEDPAAIRRLAAEQWARPVRFRETIETMYEAGVRVFLEVGPRNNLTAFVNSILRGRPYVAVAADVPHRSGLTQLNHCLGMLAVHDVAMNLSPLYSRRQAEPSAFRACQAPKNSSVGFPLQMGLQPLRLERNRNRSDDSQMGSMAASPGAYVKQGKHSATAAVYSNGEYQEGRDVADVNGRADTGFFPAAANMSSALGVKPVDSRNATMKAFLSNMEQFLDFQNEIMQQMLSGGTIASMSGGDMPNSGPKNLTNRMGGDGGVKGGLSVSINAGARVGSRFKAEQLESGGEAPLHPFIGRVVTFTPGQEVVALRTIDPDEDLFLQDHTLGREVTTGTSLSGLSLVPLTFTIEMLAEVGAMLFPNLAVTAIEDICAYRWIAVDRGPIVIELRGRLRETGNRVEVKAEIVEHTSHAGTEHPVMLAEATVILGLAYPRLAHSRSVTLLGEQGVPGLADNFYGESMFHGPRFQSVAALSRWGNDGAEAAIQILPEDRLFRSLSKPNFILDPIMLDGAGQVLGYWAFRQLDTASIIFPFKVDRLTLHREKYSRVGEQVLCRMKVTEINDWSICCDIDLIGPGDEALVSINNWKARRFNLPEEFRSLRISPADSRLSSILRDCVSGIPKEGIECCLLDIFDNAILEEHGGIWESVLAHLVLNAAERGTWRELTKSNLRRYDWLRGRCAAKDAVRLVLNGSRRLQLCPADIEIVPDFAGRPTARGTLLNGLEIQPILSISHSGEIAAAVASVNPDCLGIGIDVERFRYLGEDFEQFACSATELRFLKTLSGPVHVEWIMRLWCAKEAAAKAMGIGIRGRPRDFIAKDIDAISGHFVIVLTDNLTQENHKFFAVSLQVWTGRHNDHVFAVSLWLRS